ncbi:hypothetical protein [Halorhodospira halophila]|uniref:hypothetical protein n=1 Tax=Halorhodospira halophila TaxID=1053 RepID=UPI001911E289|nr:hypothetical protein [Halorhodospira halophila]MBK5935377.1 hypothetical protein [Halorhodospira halophila]
MALESFQLSRWRLIAPRGSVLIRTDPRRIVYRKEWHEWPRYLKRWPFWILGGNWDAGGRDLEPFRQRQMEELLACDGAYRETAFYARARAELERNGAIAEPPLHSVAELDAYLERQARILLDIRDHGYRDQTTLSGKTAHDLTVRIDRDGRLVKCREGTHRHAMLLALGHSEATVTIDLVHKHWARRCWGEHTGSLAERLRAGLQDYGEVLQWPW